MATINTTTSTEAGFMERAQAYLTASFRINSALFDPCWKTVAQNASSVQFPSYPTPSAASAQTEANSVTPAAVTVGAKTATPLLYPSATEISKQTLLGGLNIARASLDIMTNNVVAGVDKAIAAIATEATFTATPVANCITIDAFEEAKWKLENTGYKGKIIAWMSPYMLNQIMADLRNYNLPQTNDTHVTQSYRGTLNGVDIYVVPSGDLPTSTTNGKVNGFMGFVDFGIGIGYHPGDAGTLIHLDQSKAYTFSEGLGAGAYLAAVGLTATGGILIESDSATL